MTRASQYVHVGEHDPRECPMCDFHARIREIAAEVDASIAAMPWYIRWPLRVRIAWTRIHDSVARHLRGLGPRP